MLLFSYYVSKIQIFDIDHRIAFDTLLVKFYIVFILRSSLDK